MGWIEFCIRRPVFSTVLSLIITLLGVVAFDRLTVRQYPNVDEPTVSVTTTYPGASATIVESQITQVLEGSIAGIAGINVLESASRSESSRVTVRFNSDIDPDVGASDVRDRVSRVRGRLPVEVTEPVIAKVEADAQPIMALVFTSPRMTALEITDYVNRFVVDRLKNLNGVADVTIFGERRLAMRIWVDRARLAAYDLTVQDIEAALRSQNAEIPSGRIESVDREFSVLSRTGLSTPEQFANIVVKLANGHQVKLGEVARVEIGASDERRTSTFDGQPAIAVGVVRQSTANPLDVSGAVRRTLPAINAGLPEGLAVDVVFDDTLFIERSIAAVYATMLEAVVLVALVILVFLRSFRAALIPIITIPVSLIATFTLMLAFGFTLNILTLLAMVLAIGLVVDDAIVVMENIYRHIEEGLTPVAAAIKGTREIGFAVVAMTLTLAAVFAPIAFAPGKTGRLFLEFALTLAGAVVVSGFVALTLTPMMSSLLLRHTTDEGRIAGFLERMFKGLERGYRALLGSALNGRAMVVLAAAAVSASCVLLYAQLPSELAPREDQGILRIRGTAPEGATVAYTKRYADQIDEIAAGIPEVRTRLTIAGTPDVTQSLVVAPLTNWTERQRSQQQITDAINPQLRRVAGVQAVVQTPGAFGYRGAGRPVEFVIQSPATYEELDRFAEKLLARARENPGLQSLDTDLKLNSPELRVTIDRAKVADLGLDVANVGRTLETMLGGRQVTRFERDGRQYDVIVQLAAIDRAAPDALATIFLRTPRGDMVQLANLVTIEEAVAPRELKRFNQLRAVKILANLSPGYSVGEALAFLEEATRELLPETVQTDVAGQSRDYRESADSLALVFVLALAFIYLVLAAQFESFRDPLIIMLSVPLSIAGALLALWLTSGSLNVYSQIGLVTLIGLITKHGILIVEFANQRQIAGADRRAAVVDASVLRLRPILMTAATMVLGALPLALATGAGAEARQQIGWVIVGGMTVGTLLTLFVVPVVYSYIGQRHTEKAAEVAAAAAHKS
ncbi:MAG: efflux RND transporter permease subunit [Hyphomicrobiaceae bacterium]